MNEQDNKPVSVPDGWKLLPLSLTDEMCEAAADDCQPGKSAYDVSQSRWDAMLAVAPTPPAAQAGEEVKPDDYITIQKLQTALDFWLPRMPTAMGAEEIAQRIEVDSWLLTGADGDVQPNAEDAGWITLNVTTQPAAVHSAGLTFDSIDVCAFQNALRNLDLISKGLYPSRDHDLDDSYVKANISHAKQLAGAVHGRMEKAYVELIKVLREAEFSTAAEVRREALEPVVTLILGGIEFGSGGPEFDSIDMEIIPGGAAERLQATRVKTSDPVCVALYPEPINAAALREEGRKLGLEEAVKVVVILPLIHDRFGHQEFKTPARVKSDAVAAIRALSSTPLNANELASSALNASQAPVSEQGAVVHSKVRDAIAANLTSVYLCGRVWSAWNHGTMSEDDFQPADESDEFIEDITAAVVAALQSQPAQEGGDA